MDLSAGFGTVRAKRMFGGYGLYRDGVMFGLVANDALYLKVDERTRPAYEGRGLPAFSYLRRGKRVEIRSYHQAPPEALEDPEVLAEWAERAFHAALRVTGKPG
jgi:DNA transformation protein